MLNMNSLNNVSKLLKWIESWEQTPILKRLCIVYLLLNPYFNTSNWWFIRREFAERVKNLVIKRFNWSLIAREYINIYADLK